MAVIPVAFSFYENDTADVFLASPKLMVLTETERCVQQPFLWKWSALDDEVAQSTILF